MRKIRIASLALNTLVLGALSGCKNASAPPASSATTLAPVQVELPSIILKRAGM
ncbi:hypothetical protein J2S70_000624 [Trueperella bonasi]|uniref:Uncharacterized protein n=1 Tax=Trueperella bonasi TaxID=312286 RepID=A0ABT9NF86_9ACTO|nr:hypothetical protein [Trueperella bonasi]MDP9806042.1 hypothetical protein [Trueperella bonasi]